MVYLFTAFFLIFNLSSVSFSKPLKSDKARSRQPTQQDPSYEVIPLDSETAHALSQSGHGSKVSKFEAQEIAFREKISKVAQELELQLPKKVNPRLLALDCLFLQEQGLNLRYPMLTLEQRAKICEFVKERISK